MEDNKFSDNFSEETNFLDVEEENNSDRIFPVAPKKSNTLKEKISDEFFALLLPRIIDKWEKKPDSKKINFCEEEENDTTSVQEKRIMIVYFKNGNVYEGETLKNMRFHGYGQLKWKNGSVYEGSFKNGFFDGFGKLTNSNGTQYIGNMLSGQRHGQGVLVTETFLYVGEFFNSEFHGYGILQGRNQNVIPKPGDIYLNGYFERNKFINGVKVYRDGIFHGKLNEFGHCKEGEMIFTNNDYYKGEWYENEFCNYGIYKRNIPNKNFNRCIQTIPEQYYGYWLDGKPHGLGVLEIEERIVACIWKNGKRDGPGILIAANGDIFVNNKLFKNGQYLEGFRITLDNQKKNIIFRIFEICQRNTTSDNQFRIPSNGDYESLCEDAKSEEVSLSEIIESHYGKQQRKSNEEVSDWVQIKNALDSLRINRQDSDSFIKMTSKKSRNKLLTSVLDVKKEFCDLIEKLMADINGLPNSFPPTFYPKFSVDFCCTPIADCILQSIRKADKNLILHTEMRLLGQIIVSNYEKIEGLYRKYATFGTDCSRTDVMLTRIGLYKFYEDVFHNRTQISVLNLIQEADETFRILNFDAQNPFQRIYFCQFLSYLLFIVKKFYENPIIYEKLIKRSLPFYGRFGTMLILFLEDVLNMGVDFQNDIATKMIQDYPDISLKLFEIIKDVDLNIRSVFRFLKNLVENQEFLKLFTIDLNVSSSTLLLEKYSEIFTTKQIMNCILKYFPFIQKDNFITETIFSVTPLDIFRIIFKLFEMTASITDIS